jgi:hypothetical protein
MKIDVSVLTILILILRNYLTSKLKFELQIIILNSQI